MGLTKFRGLNAATSEVLEVHAQRAACDAGSELIQPERLLLGVLNNYPAKSKAFAGALNIDLSTIVSDLTCHCIPAGTPRISSGDLPPSQRVMEMIVKAAAYAGESAHEYVDVSHLLFAAANIEGAPFKHLLSTYDVDEEQLKQALESFVDDSFQQPAPEVEPTARPKSIDAASAVMNDIEPLTRDMDKTEALQLENQISLTIYRRLRESRSEWDPLLERPR